jgi:hypothetical protein
LKGKIYHVQLFFLSLLGFYPLLKFDWSSKIIAVFFILVLIKAFNKKEFQYTKQNWIHFIAMSSYFFMMLISIIYSLNKEEALAKITQFIPLIFIPFIISFSNFTISSKKKIFIFQGFIGVNIIYTLFISYLFFSNPDRLVNGLMHYALDYDKFQFIINQNPLSAAILVHKAYFSMGFVMSAIFALNAFIKNTSKSNLLQVAHLLVFVYFVIWIFYAFSFPNVIALILCVLIVLKFELKKKYFLSAVLSFLVFSSIFLKIKSNDIDFQRGFNFIKSATNSKEYEVKETRKEIYKAIFGIVDKSSLPEFLFGFGLGDVQDHLNREYKNRLLENKSKNILYYAEELDDDYWFKNKITVVKNKEMSPESIQNADVVFVDNIEENLSHNISRDIELKNTGRYTFSVFVKQSKSNMITIRFGELNQRAVFDIGNGKLFKKLDVLQANILPMENDWYRCSIVVDIHKRGLALLGFSNDTGAYVYKSDRKQSVIFWGLQLEEGELTAYSKNKNEQIQIAISQKLNTHNNYIYVFLASGCVGLLCFIFFIFYLFKTSVRSIDIFRISFCILVSLNFLTENILSRHWGLMFFSFMLLLLFNKKDESIKD